MNDVFNVRCLRSKTLTNAHALAKALDEKGLPVTSKVWGLCLAVGREQAKQDPACSCTFEAESESVRILSELLSVALEKAKAPKED